MNHHPIDQIPQHLMPIAQRLIDNPSEALRDAEVKRAIESHSALRELAQSMVDLGPVLTHAGQERDAALLSALKRRARLAAEESSAPKQSWIGWFVHSRMRWAVAGGLALVILGVIAVTQLTTSPVGHLEFSSNEILISGVPASHQAHPMIGRDDVIQVSSGSSLIRLTGGGAIAAREGARFQVVSPDEIRVDEGQVFFTGNPMRPMRVVFQGGVVTAGNAVFQLNLTGEFPEIDVNGGHAEVECPCRLTQMRGGTGILLECENGHRIYDIPNPEEIPDWLSTMLASAEGESIDVHGLFVPESCSLSPELYFSGAYDH